MSLVDPIRGGNNETPNPSFDLRIGPWAAEQAVGSPWGSDRAETPELRGLQELHAIATDEKRIGLVVGDAVSTSSGEVQLNGRSPVRNLSTTPDNRTSNQTLPPPGFDGMVGIFYGYADVAVEGVGTPGNMSEGPRPVDLNSLVLHELAENYGKTSLGFQYRPAHNRAIEVEKEVRSQRPALESSAFGGGPYIRRPDQ